MLVGVGVGPSLCIQHAKTISVSVNFCLLTRGCERGAYSVTHNNNQ